MHNTKLPFDINRYFSKININHLLSFMTKDKKNNSNKINLILLRKIGSPIINKRYSINNLKIFKLPPAHNVKCFIHKTERWQSGRLRYLGKVVTGQLVPGFESPSLRQI